MLSKTDKYYEIDDDTCPILLYRGCGNYFLDKLVDKMIEALRACRQITEVVDMRENGMTFNHIGRRFKAILAMQTKIFSVMWPDKETNLHDLIVGPKYNMIFEHPIWMKEVIENGPVCYYLLAFDRDYCAFAKRYYGNNIKDCIYFPPGGMMPETKSFGNEKKYDVTFVGSFHNYRKRLRLLYGLERPYRILAGRFVSRMVRHPNEPPEQSLEHVLTDWGLEFNDTNFANLFAKFRNAFLCVMEYYREKVIRTILEAGIEIHVYGDSWQESPFGGHPYLSCHPYVELKESLCVMQQSKISLNIMSWHKDGLTERVLNIMLSQSVLLSDWCAVLEEEFIDGKDLVLFDLTQLETLPDKIRGLLADEGRLHQIAVSGYQKTVQKHLWINRARQFLDILY